MIPLLPDLTAYQLCFILFFLALLGVATANHLPPSGTIPINLLSALPLGHLPATSQPQHPPAHIFTISPRHLSLASLALSPKRCTWTLWRPHPWPPHKSNIILISAASSPACCRCPYTMKHCRRALLPVTSPYSLGSSHWPPRLHLVSALATNHTISCKTQSSLEIPVKSHPSACPSQLRAGRAFSRDPSHCLLTLWRALGELLRRMGKADSLQTSQDAHASLTAL